MRDIEAAVQGIWHRAKNTLALASLTPEIVRSWAMERGLDVVSVEEHQAGAFAKTPAIVLTVGDVKACFPKIASTGDPAWQARRQRSEEKAALWEKMEWFSPLWISRSEVDKILNDARNCSRERAIQLFGYHTSTLYTLAFQAVCIAQILPQSRSLGEVCSLAREAYLGFYGG